MTHNIPIPTHLIDPTRKSDASVRQLHQILLWPLRLMPLPAGTRKKPWDILQEQPGSPWREVVDEYTGHADQFHERHYNEFVSFLPYVQRFIYGEGRAGRRKPGGGDASVDGGSPMHVLRRDDIVAARVTARPGEAPLMLDLVHIDLYFFYDVDVVMLNVEVAASDLTLDQAQELLYRFGRGYPGGWDADGQAMHTMHGIEWLAADGHVLASSDSHDRDAFLAFVSEHRAPRIGRHWAFLLEPLVSHHSEQQGVLRFRQIEYYRMPMMAYLAVDDPRALTRNDFVRLGFVAGATPSDGALPYAEQLLGDFEQRYCYDRFWADAGVAPRTRYLCCGHALIVVGRADSHFYTCRDRGVLAQFRHQHFLLFLIAHFQKASLLMFSDCLVEALKRLDIGDPESVRRFKRGIRATFESFLRFTHRYWFHEISEQAQVRSLFRLTSSHLGIDALYAEVKERVADMNTYLDADSLRRQANTVVRLTVVTMFGLIGTVTTGFLGMNLLDAAQEPLSVRALYFSVTFVATIALTFYTIAKSKRLSDLLDALSDERLSIWGKTKVLFAVWWSPRSKEP